MSYEENENFEPLVVLQLSSLTPDATKKWIIQRLTANHYEGADLLARFEIDMENNVKSSSSSSSAIKFNFISHRRI